MGFAALIWEIVQEIEQFVELPIPNLPGICDFPQFDSPIDAAQQLRRLWGLGNGPLTHLIRHTEANGIVVSVLPQTLAGETAAGTPEHPAGIGNVDAFSTRVSQRPLIGLTGAKGGLLRRRFNVAHEVGHLVLHHEARPGDQQHERQAHLFAAELLMPGDIIAQELPARPEPARLLPLQHRWGVSVSALGFRGRTIGKYTDSQLRRLMITLTQLGWRTNEPEDNRLLTREEPALLRQALELAEPVGLSANSLATTLALPPPLLRTLIGIPDQKPRLTLLEGGIKDSPRALQAEQPHSTSAYLQQHCPGYMRLIRVRWFGGVLLRDSQHCQA
jgi:Zn-dependent peptidase ImmA (M78 family)